MATSNQPTSRRSFLLKLGIAINAVAATLVGVPIVGYVVSALRRRSYQAWIPLGQLTQFPEGQTRLATYVNPFTVPWDGETANIACWVRRVSADRFQVFAINCAHLGCPVRWFPESGLFMCPCHGGVYYADGSRASGPPPRGLFEYEYEVRGEQLWVRGGQTPTLASPGMSAAPRTPPGLLTRIGEWLDFRLKFRESFLPSITHPIPRNTASWWYVFGSATLVCLILQLVTGICLALVYVPSASQAWASLDYLNHVQPLGWFLRAMHYWGSNFMVGLMTAHLIQVFMFGAFKYPRELTWVVGCVLFLATLGMAFTGQVMRFDQDAYWGLGIGASMLARTPLVGNALVHLLLGGPIIAGETLSRFFALHVFVIPGLLLALVGVHLLLVVKVGINEWPMPGRLVTRDRYVREYEELVERDGEPFVPHGVTRDVVFGGLTILAILFCAAVFGPKGPSGTPDPTLIDTNPRPDFWFLPLFSAFALLPAYLETVLILTAPVLLIILAVLLPFYSGTGEKSWKRRPGAWVLVILVFLILGTLGWLGTYSPWSPDMAAWSGAPVPVEYVRASTPLELQGALVLQVKQCRNCHSLGNEGGLRGPPLDDVATRLTRDQLIRQVLQGGGNMPAYGDNLSPPQVTALVAFLERMHPARQRSAREADTPPAPVAGPASGEGEPAADAARPRLPSSS